MLLEAVCSAESVLTAYIREERIPICFVLFKARHEGGLLLVGSWFVLKQQGDGQGEGG